MFFWGWILNLHFIHFQAVRNPESAFFKPNGSLVLSCLTAETPAGGRCALQPRAELSCSHSQPLISNHWSSIYIPKVADLCSAFSLLKFLDLKLASRGIFYSSMSSEPVRNLLTLDPTLRKTTESVSQSEFWSTVIELSPTVVKFCRLSQIICPNPDRVLKVSTSVPGELQCLPVPGRTNTKNPRSVESLSSRNEPSIFDVPEGQRVRNEFQPF